MSFDPLVNEFAVTIGRVKGLLLTEQTVAHAVQLLAEAARDVIPEAEGAGVTLIRNGRPISTGYTDNLVRHVDEIQYELEQGPCLTAWASSSIIRVNDTRTDPRWPQWCARAAAIPLLSCLSVPLLYGKEAVGALKVYSDQPAAFQAQAEALLVNLSSAVTALLMHVQTSETPRRMSDELDSALRGRDLIGMAKGILMERHAMTEPEAHRHLLLESARTKLPLQQIAAAIASRTENRL